MGKIASTAPQAKGEIREVGTHQDLLAERGLYWRLYQFQFYQDAKRMMTGSLADD